MNETAAANAQKVNSTAAGATAQTGPTQANASLPAGFQADATGRIFKVGGPTSEPVVTSMDAEQEFESNKTDLETRKNAMDAANGVATTETATGATATEATTATAGDAKEGATDGAGQVKSMYDKAAEETAAGKAEVDAWGEEQKSRYEGMYNTTLASIDSTLASTLQGIQQTFARRIEEQKRINNLRIGRTKAYGLGGSTAKILPIQYTDAVTLREEEAAREINMLEGERTMLIAKAEAAAREGKNDALRAHMEDLNKTEERMRDRFNAIREESDRQLEIQKELRREVEKEQQEAARQTLARLTSLASQYLDEYDKATPEEKTKLIERLAQQHKVKFSEAMDIMEEQSQTAALTKQAEEKAKKEASKEARGELRVVDGNLYQITYDENGKPISTLVQAKAKSGGSGSGDGGTGGAGGAGDEGGYEPPMSFQEFERLAAEQVGDDGKPLYTSSEQLKAKYDEYVASTGASKFTRGRVTTNDKGKSLNESQQQSADAALISKELQEVAGADGFVSPEDWDKAKIKWISFGHEPKDFDKRFATIFSNPNQSGYKKEPLID